MGITLSILGLYIIKWFWKDKVEGMNAFHRKKYDDELVTLKGIKDYAKKYNITEDEAWKIKSNIDRKHEYENRDKRLDKINPFGDEGMPDEDGNTWVDYSYMGFMLLIAYKM